MSCPDCVTGSIHSGIPKGTETKLGGIDTYVTGDENSKRIIVIGVDVFGWRFVNTRLLADEYAAKGFRVYIPDLFGGWELPMWCLLPNDPANPPANPSFFNRYVSRPAAYFLILPFILRNIGRQVSIISSVASALRASSPAPAAKIGFVGFCWGGRFAFKLNHLFDATVACHPSLVQFPAELDGIKNPFSLAVAATDEHFNGEKAAETEKILKGKGLEHVQTVVYEGVNHGWTTRGDMSDPVKKKGRDDAVAQVVDWFEKYLTPSS